MYQILGVAAVVGIAYDLLSGTDADHDDVVEQTADALASASPSHATVYADHLSHRDYPNPAGEIDGVTKVPDVVLKAGPGTNNLICEIETAESLADRGEDAEAQLRDFSTGGYTRVLVVPDGALDHDDVSEFKDRMTSEVSGSVYLSSPSQVAEYL